VIPSVGRAVHYVARGSADGVFPKACRAADVTEVAEGENPDLVVGLMVKNPSGLFFHSVADGGCEYDGSQVPAGGTWHWPERV
jgi:hypothetical protein